MSKYSHYEMCEKIFGQRYKWNEQKQDYELYSRTDMWNKLIEQQDKILELQEQSIRDNQNWIEETTQLNQQLHDLPKKIVREVENNFTEYLPLKDKTGAGFYARLNAILKKYGGD